MSDTERSWEYDLFICHASEDRNSLARPLKNILEFLGIRVWFDESSLRIGDSSSRSVDRGLANSKYAAVLISPHFLNKGLNKGWTEYEFRGLITREVKEGRRVIIPIWHGVSWDEVAKFSLPLADKAKISTEGQAAEDVAFQVLGEVAPEIYEKYSRRDLLGWDIEKDLRDFAIAIKEYEREILKGVGRVAMQESCEGLLAHLSEFRGLLSDYLLACNQYNEAQFNCFPDYPTEPWSTVTYNESDYIIEQSREKAVSILNALKVWAERLEGSINLVEVSWKNADPNKTVSQLTQLLSRQLSLCRHVAKMILDEDSIGPHHDWWVKEKLPKWVKQVSEAESNINAAYSLLVSWSKFDPRDKAVS